MRAVLDGQLDLAFAALPSDYPAGLSVRSLASEPTLLAGPPGSPLAKRHQIALEELDGQRFVDFPSGWGTRLSVDRIFREAGLRREIAVEIADVPIVIELVLAGFGYAILAPSTVADTRSLTLRPVRPSPVFVLSLITAEAAPRSAAARAFFDPVAATYPDLRTLPDPQ